MMKKIIYQYLINQNKKRIETKNIESYVLKTIGSDNYWKQGGYTSFVQTIELLVAKNILRPVKAWKLNGMNPPLYNGYQIISLRDELNPIIKQNLLTQYHPAMNTAYYLNHQADYEQDKIYLSALNCFLKENAQFTTLPAITVNERSFQIFHDEKWLASKHGHNVLQRVGLTFKDLCCYPTYEPFFYYQRKIANTSEINVLIIENKDTFFSLKSLFQNGVYSWNNIPFTLLIYGEGRKIQKSFSFFWELNEYQQYKPRFYYFGDLDPEGISIWHQLQKQEAVEFKPFVFFYNALFEKYAHIAPKVRKEQRFLQQAVESFLTYFSTSQSKLMLNILKEGRYLPQEGLNYQLLHQLSD